MGEPAPYLVSAIVSTYNAEAWLPACLDDLEAQTISDRIEILVVDSGSEQDERSVVAEYRRRYGNIRYLRTERETLYAAWNRGVRMARGRYITNANTDDAHRPDALELLVDALDAHPDADLAYGNYAWTSRPADSFRDSHAYRLVLHPPYHPGQVMFFCVAGCHPLWRRRVFDRIGLFDERYRGPGDYEFLMRFASAGLRAVLVPELLSLFYQNPTGLTNTAGREEAPELYRRYRTRTAIHRLYRVGSRDRRGCALAWAAQGNLAMRCSLPYGDDLLSDWQYAEFCYERALERDPECAPARHNLAVVTLLHGRMRAMPKLLARLPADERRSLLHDFRAGRPRLVSVDVAAAVAPLEHRAARPLRARRLVRWCGPLFATGEEAAEGRETALALACRIPLAAANAVTPYAQSAVSALDETERRALLGLAARYPAVREGTAIVQSADVQRPQGAARLVGRATSATGAAPRSWLARRDELDEVWVPSAGVAAAFAGSGFVAARVAVVPTPVDVDRFDPAGVVPAELPARPRVAFLAPLGPGQSCQILLRAYFDAFTAGAGVCLYLWLHAAHGRAAETRAAALRRVRRAAAGRSGLPRVEVVTAPAERPGPEVYGAVDCVAVPGGSDAWGRMPLEAMAAGVPVIAAPWGALADAVAPARGYPLRFAQTSARGPEGSRARPSEAHLADLLRSVANRPAEARRRGRAARAYVLERHSRDAVATAAASRLRLLERRLPVVRHPDEEPTAPALLDVPVPPDTTRALLRRAAAEGADRPVLPPAGAALARAKPRRARGVRIERLDDGIVVHAPSTGSIHDLNRVAALLVELSTGANTWRRIVRFVQVAYGLEEPPEEPLAAALAQLVAAGVLSIDRRRRS